LALRLGGAVHGLAEARLLERIIRGRAWIAILGVGLIGIVFMQVSMLRMNAGIGSAVDRATALERQNAAMRATISELTSGDRVVAEAAKLGFVAPPTGSARFLDAGHFDPARALHTIQPPSHLAPLPTGMLAAMAQSATTTTLTPAGVTAAPQATATTTSAPPAAPASTASTTGTSSGTATPTSTTAATSSTGAAASPPPAPTATTTPASTGGASAGGAG
jgi:hypothetical protein